MKPNVTEEINSHIRYLIINLSYMKILKEINCVWYIFFNSSKFYIILSVDIWLVDSLQNTYFEELLKKD
jgi:hypothetical protein